MNKITADTNLLLRVAIRDDPRQAAIAQAALDGAELIAVTTQSLCEFAWVLRHSYKQTAAKIAAAIRVLINTENLVIDRLAVATGLATLDAGGDFADGVVFHEGVKLGGEVFVSFDKKAAKLLKEQGADVQLLS